MACLLNTLLRFSCQTAAISHERPVQACEMRPIPEVHSPKVRGHLNAIENTVEDAQILTSSPCACQETIWVCTSPRRQTTEIWIPAIETLLHRQRDKLTRHAAGTDRHGDILPPIEHIGHRNATLVTWQFE